MNVFPGQRISNWFWMVDFELAIHQVHGLILQSSELWWMDVFQARLSNCISIVDFKLHA